jgi:hypothetical protein
MAQICEDISPAKGARLEEIGINSHFTNHPVKDTSEVSLKTGHYQQHPPRQLACIFLAS